IEDVELDLGAEVGGGGDAALGQERFSFFPNEAWVACVALARSAWLDDIADDAQCRDGARGIEKRRVRVRQQQHVRLVNFLEAADGRPVEADALAEEALLQLLDRVA